MARVKSFPQRPKV